MQTTVSEIRSARIRRLEADLAAGSADAVEQLRAELESGGAPIVEPVSGEPGRVLVTFVWLGEAEHVSVFISSGPSRRMHRLSDSSVWFLSVPFDSDICVTYHFIPDDPTVSFGDDDRIGLGFMKQDPDGFAAVMAEWAQKSRSDPFNPNKMHEESSYGPRADGYESVLTLPDTPPFLWIDRRPDVPQGRVDEHTVTSTLLGNERKVWVYTPAGYSTDADPYPVVLLLDGGEWQQNCPTATVLDNMIAAGKLPPLVSVWVDNATSMSRMVEMACHDPFNDFLADELLPWARRRYRITDNPAKTVIGGVSYGGLASGYAGFGRSDVFGNVLSLSASYWWGYGKGEPGALQMGRPGHPEPVWLAGQYAATEKLPVRFYVEAGRLETFPFPESPGVTLIVANRHMRDVLIAKGYDVTYREVPGCHDFATWRRTFAEGLEVLLGPKG